MIFLFPRWDMLIPWRVFLSSCFFFDLNCGLFTLFFFPDKSSEARFLNKFPAQLTFSYFIYSTLESHFYIWVFPKIGVPQNGWFLLKKLIKMDDLGYHCFRKHPYSTFALRPVICPRVIFREQCFKSWRMNHPTVLVTLLVISHGFGKKSALLSEDFQYTYLYSKKKTYIHTLRIHVWYIYLHLGHVGKYTIHGSSGIYTWKGPY